MGGVAEFTLQPDHATLLLEVLPNALVSVPLLRPTEAPVLVAAAAA